MPPARNDPCPCGSGKKYKRCCQPHDERRRANLAVIPGLADRVGSQAAGSAAGDTWDAGVVPVPIQIDDTPDARPAAVLITGDGFVLHVDVLAHPPSEPAEIAAVIAEAVGGVAREGGVTPRRLRVTHAPVAEALRALAPDGVRVEHGPQPELDAIAADLLEHFGAEGATSGKVGMVSMWRGWGLPDAQVRELFQAAAVFHRAAPWRDALNEQLLDLETASGARWAVCVLGNGGAEFGLALYSDRKDFERQIDEDDQSEAFAALRGPMVSLTFSRRNDLPPPMRKEIIAAGWEVAGPTAYPVLMTVNTLAGGVTAAQAGDLATALRAVPGFVTAHRDLLRSLRKPERPVRWKDSGSGATLGYTGPAGLVFEPLWPPPETLEPSLPVGPGARPEAALEARDPYELAQEHDDLVERFEEAEHAGGRATHLIARDAALADIFLEFLTGAERIPVAAATEYDLRMFLYDWFPRKVEIPLQEARALPVALKRFLAFVAEAEGVEFPWAAAILADRERLDERLRTFPGGFFWDADVQEWQQEAHEDLDHRVLFTDSMLGEGEMWADEMGLVEYALQRELHRRWLLWRDEVIRTGVTHPADVRAALVARQRRWVETPHPAHGGKTPVAVVLAERQTGARRQ